MSKLTPETETDNKDCQLNAGYFASKQSASIQIDDKAETVRVETEDYEGNPITLEYRLSQIVVSEAEYDVEEPTVTTAPANITRRNLELDGVNARMFWNSMLVEFEEDYIVATGTYPDGPVDNEYDAYWVLTKIEDETGELEYLSPFLPLRRCEDTAETLQESDHPIKVEANVRGLIDEMEEYLPLLRKIADGDAEKLLDSAEGLVVDLGDVGSKEEAIQLVSRLEEVLREFKNRCR